MQPNVSSLSDLNPVPSEVNSSLTLTQPTVLHFRPLGHRIVKLPARLKDYIVQ